MKGKLPTRSQIERSTDFAQCKEWAARAAAAARYAKAAQDIEAQEQAERIQRRACIRIGELLLKIPNAQGQGHPGCGPDPGSRRQTILRHKLGDAALTSIAMARVPKRVREKLIEASPPITATVLAALGTRKRAAPENRFRAGPAYRLAAGLHNEGLGGFVRWMRRHPPAKLARQMKPQEAARLADLIETIDEWLDEFIRHTR